MKLIQSAMLITAASLTSGCDGLYPYASELKQNGQTLSGTFTLKKWPTALGAIKSDGTGGACITVAMKDIPGFRNMKCTAPEKACGPHPAGQPADRWYIYCDLPPDAPDGAVGQCWGKPTNRKPAEFDHQLTRQFCNRSGDHVPPMKWPPDTAHPVGQDPVELDNGVYHGMSKPSHWRATACVKESPGSLVSKCVWGPVTEVN